MTREEAIAIIENEKECVNRANKNDYCNRDCYNCELVKTDTEILTALDMAIEVLEQEPCKDWHDVPSDEMTLGQARQAVKDLRKKLAEYLWQTPCKDAISRQSVIDVIERWLECSGYNEAERNIMNAVQSVLCELPPVNPQPKMGRWEWVQYDYNPKLGNWHCSECRSIAVKCVDKNEKGGIPLYKYCPNCGAKMVEPQESEG